MLQKKHIKNDIKLIKLSINGDELCYVIRVNSTLPPTGLYCYVHTSP